MASLTERYVASMVLSGVGDALGFRNGRWEFCNSGEDIHKDLGKLGGLENVLVALPKWKVSDDTVMHLATAEALIENGGATDSDELFCCVAKHYKKSMDDMHGRSAGFTCRGAYALEPHKAKGYHVPFDGRGGGCGAAMRAMCIGLRYPKDTDLDMLIAVSVESGRMTHHHPTGYLGAMAGALFVTYSLQNKPVHEWGAGLMQVLPKAQEYVISKERYVEENKNAWDYFTRRWNEYLKKRKITDGKSEAQFPEKYGIKDRDEFYKSLSYDGWGGASGHDAPMIAYDALLCAGSNWEKLCKHGMFHSGDNDSTGVIAGACWGAMYGIKDVPEKNYKNLEYRDRLKDCAIDLLKLSYTEEEVNKSFLDEFLKPLVTADEKTQDKHAQESSPADNSTKLSTEEKQSENLNESESSSAGKTEHESEVPDNNKESRTEEKQSKKLNTSEAPSAGNDIESSMEVTPSDNVNEPETTAKEGEPEKK